MNRDTSTNVIGIGCLLLAAVIGLLLWARPATPGNGAPSAGDKQELTQMIAAMSAGDLSTLEAVLQQDGDAVVGTMKGSANDKFYTKMESLGYAVEATMKKDLPPEAAAVMSKTKLFSLTKEGKAFLKDTVAGNAPPVKTVPVTPAVVQQIQKAKTE